MNEIQMAKDSESNRSTDDDAMTGVGAVAHLRELIADPHNRRLHNARNIQMIADSLSTVGAARSVVVDENGVVLCGNGVVAAAAQAGIEHVRIIEADGKELIAVRRVGLSAEQKRSLSMADNRTSELSRWSIDQLRADADAGLDLFSFFAPAELADLLHSDAPTPRFEPIEPTDKTRLDQLASDTSCPNCGHRFRDDKR